MKEAQAEYDTGIVDPKITMPKKGSNPEEQAFLKQLVKSLQVKTTPTFCGDSKEDPVMFEKKALDYMEACDIEPADMTAEFKHCLEGKACVWYDEIQVPQCWDDLMEKFRSHFCVYGHASEDWYHQWNKMSFDLNSNNDIEEFITEVKSLQSVGSA